jgi:hypothetical protein
MAVKHRFLNERSGTMFNSNRPKLTVLQSDQGCVTARIASRLEEWSARLNPRYWCRVTVFDLCIARGHRAGAEFTRTSRRGVCGQ